MRSRGGLTVSASVGKAAVLNGVIRNYGEQNFLPIILSALFLIIYIAESEMAKIASLMFIAPYSFKTKNPNP